MSDNMQFFATVYNAIDSVGGQKTGRLAIKTGFVQKGDSVLLSAEVYMYTYYLQDGRKYLVEERYVTDSAPLDIQILQSAPGSSLFTVISGGERFGEFAERELPAVLIVLCHPAIYQALGIFSLSPCAPPWRAIRQLVEAHAAIEEKKFTAATDEADEPPDEPPPF